MNDYLSFDIELYKEMEEGERELNNLIPSTAAICTNYDDTEYFDDDPFMTKETANKLVDKMIEWDKKDYKILGWNTLNFDLHLLGIYSDRIDDCARLAMNHYDMMFTFFCYKGYYLSLDKALSGANIETKLHQVTLNDGSTFDSMTGSKAPLLWRNKEFSAVRDYLKVDVQQPLKLARHIELTKSIKWISNSGKQQRCIMDMLTVKESIKLPPVDQSWMKEPKDRIDSYSWIPKHILEKELNS